MPAEVALVYLRLRLKRVHVLLTNLLGAATSLDMLGADSVDSLQVALTNELNSRVQDRQLDISQVLKVDSLRSELDSIGVALLFTKHAKYIDQLKTDNHILQT